jgi:hypothetical protein
MIETTKYTVQLSRNQKGKAPHGPKNRSLEEAADNSPGRDAGVIRQWK